jgi:poly(hydroxyalkanoate) depolymerase family esterase
MHPTLKALMQHSTQLTRAGKLAEATAAIQRALGGGGHASPPPPGQVHEGRVFDMEPAAPDTQRADAADVHAAAPATARTVEPHVPIPDAAPAPFVAPDSAARTDDPGQFISGNYADAQTHAARPYKLYVPPGHAGRALPLVVMLHGCTQDPDDFAAGTGMNRRAREQGFFVLYPQQTVQANPTRCWNWFAREHQQRGVGEPALLAGMVSRVVAEYGIDARRVYVAGLSAGGAMAAILAAEYPDVFAAVGVHSGLPRGAARNVLGALAVMRSGGSAAQPTPPAPEDPLPVPAIIFHGDADRTVHPRNGERLVGAALGAPSGADPPPQVTESTSSAGRAYTRSVHAGADGQPVAEHWLVHGMGHAWSGGDPAGTYTDASGPDATAEMLRFFFARSITQTRAGTH